MIRKNDIVHTKIMNAKKTVLSFCQEVVHRSDFGVKWK